MPHVQYLTQGHVGIANTDCHRGSTPRASSWRTASLLATSPPPLSDPPDSSSEMRAFPHLIVRHDIERVPVQGEGHVPEDAAAILHHSHCLVQHSSLQRAVHPDLQRHRDTETRDGECRAVGQSDWTVSVLMLGYLSSPVSSASAPWGTIFQMWTNSLSSVEHYLKFPHLN